MDAATPPIRFNRLLPYWAVLQTDLRQTCRSWVFRLWVILSVVAAASYGLYKFGIHREAGIVQSATMQTGDLIRGVAAANLALIALLAVSAVSLERSTVADAVLSRGISRRQYFLAKWHARSLVVVVTLVLLSAGVLTGYHYLLDPDVTWRGGVAATVIASAVMFAVVAWGVTVGALASGTVIGITLFWLVLYGVIVLSSFLPDPFPSPTFVIAKMRAVLRGHFQEMEVVKVAGGFLAFSLIGAAIGLIGFGRKDV